mmetsp:Transcript_3414/g.9738  ORF Transcript_3414/g.9738 Transcript_3414/m.9738 type:complete len:368 (+) Transcript_3414:87-1190(+)
MRRRRPVIVLVGSEPTRGEGARAAAVHARAPAKDPSGDVRGHKRSPARSLGGRGNDLRPPEGTRMERAGRSRLEGREGGSRPGLTIRDIVLRGRGCITSGPLRRHGAWWERKSGLMTVQDESQGRQVPGLLLVIPDLHGHFDEVHDARADLIEPSDDEELVLLDLVLHTRVAEQVADLVGGVGDNSLAVARVGVCDVVERLLAVLELALHAQKHLLELWRLVKDGLRGQARGLDRAAALVSHDDHELDAEVVDGVVDGARHVVSVQVARVTHHKHIADALVQNHLDGHARVCAAEHRHLGHLPVDELAALHSRHVDALRGAVPEARVPRLEGLENLAGAHVAHLVVPLLGEGLGLLERLCAVAHRLE